MSRQSYPLHRATDAPASPDLPALEREVLDYWKQDATFQASVDRNPAGDDGSNEFVFYDGPPFANGLPHYGHLLTGYAKDVVPRYKTMQGKRVERRFGWDTHGLPAELEAMNQLGIKTKDEILEVGIEKFNAACRQSVMKYTAEWQDYVTRQARWVDFDNDYQTMNLTYMESVMWGFKQLWDKGLVYEGFRVLPYCWNDQTPLSNHELRMDDDVYQDRQDTAVTVGFRVTAVSAAAGGAVQVGDLVLIWTTTPWTLPSNLLAAVGADIEYVVVASSKPTGKAERYIVAADRLATYARDLTDEAVADSLDGQVVARLSGADLAGTSYQPPFRYYQGAEAAHRIVEADFVTTTDGTGVVHIAPAFGEDDKLVADREGVTTVMPVGPDGCFTFPVAEYEGVQVFDANPKVLDHLKARLFADADGVEGDTGATTPGTVMVRRESYNHSYPHCWRCRQPLIYMGVSSWFVAVTKIKDRMLELNEEITWTPDHIKHGIFGKWLENARDWSITRNRFWGSPVPVWKSDNPQYPRVDVYGSLADLQADFGVEVTDLHRPSIDDLTRPNPDDPSGQSTMRRVEDVMDVWVDSGSMPYAQVHYPFENTDWFEHHYPGDFIVEYIGQTRGWFYVLHVLATAIFDRPAFRSCVSHGIVLGSDGRKMSKSLKNYPDVTEVFDRDGSDAMRWFLMSSPILRGGNLVVTEEGIRDSVRQVLLPLWSTYYFFTLYANNARRIGEGQGYQARLVTDGRIANLAPLDRYILAKTHDLVATTTAQLDAYDIAGACESIRVYLDVLTNWYVRTQRDRFWAEDADAFDTLYTVLETLCRVAAPLAPLLTEEVWRGLTGGRSVHLENYPTVTAAWDDA
ncbi:MAG: isoleucine--tRNA ligase, partial [Cellulomonadaceae bacterium]|nr:isoleucine--tRNA ligase [Cellulomonadaceae bacterium]